MTRGKLHYVGILQVSYNVVPIIAGSASRIGSRDEAGVTPQFQSGLEGECSVLLLVLRCRARVNEKHGNCTRPGGKAGGVLNCAPCTRDDLQPARPWHFDGSRAGTWLRHSHADGFG